MPVILNWDGSIAQAADPTKERTAQGGRFTGVHGITTYFPPAGALSALVSIIGYYSVPPNFADRPDLVANFLYGSTDYWWVIFWANQITDPFGRPRAGEVIAVVDIKALNNLLNPSTTTLAQQA